jgi:hypothetical protein
MSNTRKVPSKAANNKRNTWDEAITDARLKIAALRKTIQVYEIRRDAGDPWPGGQSEGHTSERQHSV